MINWGAVQFAGVSPFRLLCFCYKTNITYGQKVHIFIGLDRPRTIRWATHNCRFQLSSDFHLTAKIKNKCELFWKISKYLLYLWRSRHRKAAAKRCCRASGAITYLYRVSRPHPECGNIALFPPPFVCGKVQPPRGSTAPAAPTSGNVQPPLPAGQHPKGVIFNPLQLWNLAVLTCSEEDWQ